MCTLPTKSWKIKLSFSSNRYLFFFWCCCLLWEALCLVAHHTYLRVCHGPHSATSCNKEYPTERLDVYNKLSDDTFFVKGWVQEFQLCLAEPEAVERMLEDVLYLKVWLGQHDRLCTGSTAGRKFLRDAACRWYRPCLCQGKPYVDFSILFLTHVHPLLSWQGAVGSRFTCKYNYIGIISGVTSVYWVWCSRS